MDAFTATELLSFFSKRIRLFRKKIGITQEQAAETLGITAKHISELERGITAPSLDLLVRIASFYGVPPSELLLTEPEIEKSQLIKKITILIAEADRATLQTLLKICLAIIK